MAFQKKNKQNIHLRIWPKYTQIKLAQIFLKQFKTDKKFVVLLNLKMHAFILISLLLIEYLLFSLISQ